MSTSRLGDVFARIIKDGGEEDAYTIARLKGMMIGYDLRWAYSGWKANEIEVEYHLPIINPETGAKSRTFTHAGKIDVLAKYDAQHYIVEHKTTSDDISDPNGPYWRELEVSAQINEYSLAETQVGRKPAGTLYDVVRKPAIRPRKVTKAEATHLQVNGTYHGYDISVPGRGTDKAGQIETPEMYLARVAEVVTEDPARYFGRKIIRKLDQETLEYAEELWDLTQSLLHTRSRGVHGRTGVWTGGCMQWSRPCEFLSVCSGHDEITSDKWKKREKVHEELDCSEFLGGGANVLTKSRASCYSSCHKKHWFKYEQGIEASTDKTESLRFGTLWHAAQEVWWGHFMAEGAKG